MVCIGGACIALSLHVIMEKIRVSLEPATECSTILDKQMKNECCLSVSINFGWSFFAGLMRVNCVLLIILRFD